MTTTQIAFRANGLYEEIVKEAVQGLDIEVTILPQGQDVTYKHVQHVKMGWRDNAVTDSTVAMAHGSDYGNLDQVIASAYRESLGAVTSTELTAMLLGMVAKKFPPSKVYLVRRNIDDHPVGVRKESIHGGYEDWETNGLDFYAKLIEQATGLAPEVTSGSLVEATDTEWVIIDRHALNKVDVQGGLTLVVPPENLARSVAVLGLIGQEESDTWKQAAVQKLREKLIS